MTSGTNVAGVPAWIRTMKYFLSESPNVLEWGDDSEIHGHVRQACGFGAVMLWRATNRFFT